jgi:hypothetical protein
MSANAEWEAQHQPWSHEEQSTFYRSKLRTMKAELQRSREDFHGLLYQLNLKLAVARRQVTRAGSNVAKRDALAPVITGLQKEVALLKTRHRERVEPKRREIANMQRFMKRYGL